MDQLPHTSSSQTSGSMPRHTISVKSIPAAQATNKSSATQILNAVASSSKTTISSSPSRPASGSPPHTNSRPQLPPRPSFGRRQHYDITNSTYTQLASGIARVQAQPHKPKRPSPLHTSHSPESLEAVISNSSTSSSPSESSPELCHVEHAPAGLGIIAEEKEKEKEKGNMLGLELDGWNWYGEIQERLMEPRTPYPSPAIYA